MAVVVRREDRRPVRRQAFAMAHVEAEHEQHGQPHQDAVEEQPQQRAHRALRSRSTP
jgi:hypothetical protein